MSDFPIAIEGGFNRGEEVLERLDVREHQGLSRRLQGRLLFVLVLFVLGIFYVSISTPLYLLGWLPLLVIIAVLWRILSVPLLVMFPPITELIITNQRLLLRSGVIFVPWVLNYGDEIEVLVVEEKSSFIIRPKRTICSPHQVYCTAVSPFHRGRQLAELTRSLSAEYLAHPGFNANNASISASGRELGIAAGASVPPGIILMHGFLTNQLRSIITAIPTYSFDHIDASIPSQEPTKELTKETPELGATAYHFGVEND